MLYYDELKETIDRGFIKGDTIQIVRKNGKIAFSSQLNATHKDVVDSFYINQLLKAIQLNEAGAVEKFEKEIQQKDPQIQKMYHTLKDQLVNTTEEIDGEFVLLAEDGANITMRNSPIAYLTQGKFWLNNHAHIMAMKDGSNNFLVQLLEKQNYEKYNSGTAQPKLNSQVVKSLNFLFPTKEEQQKIGSFFKQLDDNIALHQRKLDLLKEQKKGFLQKMFV